MFDLNFSGCRYTWCNNQSCVAHCWTRLDNCLVNLAWLSFFSSYSLTHLPWIFSDHTPPFFSLFPSIPLAIRSFFVLIILPWLHWLPWCYEGSLEFLSSGKSLACLYSFSISTHVKINAWRSAGLTPLDIALKDAKKYITSLERVESSGSDV